jgi:hypothetical protein
LSLNSVAWAIYSDGFSEAEGRFDVFLASLLTRPQDSDDRHVAQESIFGQFLHLPPEQHATVS